jgi:hypothetical protein
MRSETHLQNHIMIYVVTALHIEIVNYTCAHAHTHTHTHTQNLTTWPGGMREAA